MLKKSTLMLASGIVLGLASCSKDNKDNGGSGNAGAGRFIIAAVPTSTGSEGVADYLLTAENLESGTLSTEGNGLEQDGTYRYYTTSGTKFFSMLYGQGNPGAVTVYQLDKNGKMQKLTNFQSETVQSFAAVGKDILMVKEARKYATPTSRWYRVSTESLTIVAEGQFNSAELANNGELAHFSWIEQVGNKVFAPFFSIKATDAGGWSTDYPDSAWVAVYSYPDMTLEKVIKDNRTSSIGLYFTNGLTKVENGDVYAFSPSNTIKINGTAQSFNSTKPSSIIRIKSGTTEFDQSYLFNIEAVAGGAYMTSWINVGKGVVVATLNTSDKKSQWQVANKLAVIDLVNKTFKWVTGAPDAAAITDFSMTNYSAQDGKAYIGITTSDKKSAVYKIDAGTATATRGLELVGGNITAIQWLPAQ
ncbi:DUF4374 domain-containing protein [Taibaiella chishuiensis]|nr:DUF4374 domain-containing protein [Taibaiella chishuiensis]